MAGDTDLVLASHQFRGGTTKRECEKRALTRYGAPPIEIIVMFPFSSL